MNIINNKGFTFVELIIVIGIISILGSIGIYSFYGYISDANDAKRVTDIQSIKIELDNYRRNHSLLYPTAEGGSGTTQIMSGSEILAIQSDFNELISGKALIKKVPLDPKSQTPYLYSISRDRTSYQITATLESPNNLITYNPIFEQAYADNIVAYVEGSFIPENKTIFPGLLYAVEEGTMELKIDENDINGNPNVAKVILNGQSLNLAYDMKGNVVSEGTDLTALLSSISLVQNTNTSDNNLSCNGVINTENIYYNGENDVQYLDGTSLGTQIGWKYKTCDGNTGTMKPDGSFYYNCANIGAGAIFDNTCKWTGCSIGYTVKTDGTPGCKLNVLGPELATPINGAYSIPNYGVLTWLPVSGVNIEYKVYLGLNTVTPSLVSTQNNTSYSFSSLPYSKTYNWYVEACDNGICTASTIFSFSTANEETSSGTTITDPNVANCEIEGAVCHANDVAISYVGTSGTPLDGVDGNFGVSEKIVDKYYGQEKILEYKITNNSYGRAKFKIKLSGSGSTLDFKNSANASFDDSNIGTIIDLGGDGIANNLFWKTGSGCIYNYLTGGYEVIGKTTCFITFNARSDASIGIVDEVIGQFQIVNIDSLATWSTSFTIPTNLKMRSSGYSLTSLAMSMYGTGQQTLEPSNDILGDDFGTSTRIGGTSGLNYGYWKSLTYTISNSNGQKAYFKIGLSGQNTNYIDSLGNARNYNFALKVIDATTQNPAYNETFTGSTTIDWGNDGVGNFVWKNDNCTQSSIGTNIGKGFIINANSNCNITLYYRSSPKAPYYSRNFVSVTLLNQTISGKTYTYDKTLKGRSEGFMIPFENFVQSEIFGWIKLHLETYGSSIMGYAESEAVGWICFDDTCGANISRDTVSGALSGYALSEMFGWIKLDGVYLKNDGTTEGYAESETLGWIKF